MEKKVRARQIKTTTVTSSEIPVHTINQAEFAQWFSVLQSLRGRDDTIEAPAPVVAKLENDYPGCFKSGYFMFHGMRVIPEGKRDEVEAQLNQSLEAKMHGVK